MARMKPVTIRGVSYRSVTEAAKALGCSSANIVQMNRKGKIDYVGLGRGKLIEIDGVTYRSRALASRILDIPIHKLNGAE